MPKLREIGSVVYFGRRRGHIVGYATVKPHSHQDGLTTLAIVDLDPESRSYLYPTSSGHEKDCFVSMLLVNPDNFDDEA